MNGRGGAAITLLDLAAVGNHGQGQSILGISVTSDALNSSDFDLYLLMITRVR